jgi:succinate dehydrogenase hydrophobic anchor subunit
MVRRAAVGVMELGPGDALLAASSLHLGFQALVTVVVYPALADVPPDRFAAAHADHSRRITAVVAPVYAVLAVACLAVLVAGPHSAAALTSVAAAAVAAGVTALVAAPAHGRLGREGRSADVLRRLRTADGVRLAAAVVGVLGALFVAG